MLKNLKQRNEGFTIIEVMIVLAIAGLIMLVVFLAVPALQRNSRNSQRSADASRIAAAVNECLNNNNGRVANCNNLTAAQLNNYINMADNSQLVGTAGAGLDGVALAFNSRCDANGAAPVAGGGNRAFTVAYQIETRNANAPRCLGS